MYPPIDAEITIISSDEEDDEEDDDHEDEPHLLNAKGISSEYAGQVQTLVDMFEKFAQNCKSEPVKNGNKQLSSTTTSKGTTPTSNPNLVNSSMTANGNGKSPTPSGTDDSLITVGQTLSSLESLESRVKTLETKMSAVFTFETEMLINDIKVIGQTNARQLQVERSLSSLSSTTKMLDSELDEISEHLEDVESTLVKENKTLKIKVAMLEKIALSGKETVKLRLTHLEGNLSRLTSLLQNLTDMVSELAQKQRKQEEQGKVRGEQEEGNAKINGELNDNCDDK